MKQTQIVAFNDHISSSGAIREVVSADQFALTLGMFDQIAFTVSAEQVRGTNPSLQVQVWHSGDGLHWLPKAADPEVPFQGFDSHGTNVYIGFVDTVVPTLRYVRFVLVVKVDIGFPGFDVAVRIDAVLNDSRESAFSAKMHDTLKKQDMNKCASYVQGGSMVNDPAMIDALMHSGDAQLTGSLDCSYVPGTTATQCQIAPDASLCIKADGSATLAKPGGQITVPSPAGNPC